MGRITKLSNSSSSPTINPKEQSSRDFKMDEKFQTELKKEMRRKTTKLADKKNKWN
jgi:hypothetical protein